MKTVMASLISAVVLMASLLFQSPATALAAPFFQPSVQQDKASQVETISQKAGDALQDTIGSITGEGGQNAKQGVDNAKAAGKEVDRNTKALIAKDNKLVKKATN